MKIGFVLDDTLDTPDGVQQYVLTLGAWFLSQGHDVHYLVGQTSRTDVVSVHSLSKNMHVRFNGNRMSMPLPAPRIAIRDLLKREVFDVLHVQMPYSPWLAHRIIQAAPSECAVIGTFHIAPHSVVVSLAAKALAIWTRRSLRRFDSVVSVSQAAADFARSSYGLSTTIVPNVVNVSYYSQATAYPRYADKPTLVFLGRLVPRKGCQLLLEAVSKLQQQSPQLDYRVIICGKGPLMPQLQAYVAKHKLTARVEFSGYVSEIDKARYLKSADVAVYPSSGGESFGIVLIETMAAGHSVVLAADNPGYAAVLAPYPAVLFPVNDVSSLAQKIQLFLTNRSARQSVLQWQASYVGQFDVGVVGGTLSNLYEQAMASRRA